MKTVPLPTIDYIVLIKSCVGSIDSEELRDKLNNIIDHLIQEGDDYLLRAPNSDLYLTPEFMGADDAFVKENVTKKELKNLYTTQFVPKEKPSRAFYDQIKLLAPLGICPFCGFGHVKTLDHYLPKAKFPLLSIFPFNLVPCCTDCNNGKNAKVTNKKEMQCFHPYYPLPLITEDQWLFAYIEQSSPAVVKFFVNPPHAWDAILKIRTRQHFLDYDLDNRFSIQAGTELANLRNELLIDFESEGITGVKKTLLKKARASFMTEKNSWKTAMYAALSNNTWFWSGGFMKS